MLEAKAEEYFDLFNSKREPIGKIGNRGSLLGDGEYHLVVMAIIKNGNGKILITKRSKMKLVPGKWECTAGSALAGEKSSEAIKREIKEEIGIDVDIGRAKIISEYWEDDAVFDIWEIEINNEIGDLVLQLDEVDEAKYATISDIKGIIEKDEATKSLGEVVKLYEIGKLKAAYE